MMPPRAKPRKTLSSHHADDVAADDAADQEDHLAADQDLQGRRVVEPGAVAGSCRMPDSASRVLGMNGLAAACPTCASICLKFFRGALGALWILGGGPGEPAAQLVVVLRCRPSA